MESEHDTGASETAADRLAMERTALAGERTVLAYVRTALGLAGAGFSLAEFFPLWPIGAGGLLLAVGAVAALAIGAVRFHQIRQRTRYLERTLRAGSGSAKHDA